MSRQTQWLFDVPVALKGDRSTNLHTHPEYYQHPELEEEHEVSFIPAIQEELWRDVPEWETAELLEYPKASRFVPAKFYSKSTKPRKIRRIVIHITDGGSKIQGTVSWFQHMLGKDGKPAVHPETGKLLKASAHYIVGQDGEVVQMVRENDVAYHAGSANADSIGIEHVANTRGLKPTPALYCSSAALVRCLCQKYSIPRDRIHILGHAEADPKTTHKACPNAVWDWTYFMNLVTGKFPCSPVLPPNPTPPQPSHVLDISRAVQRNDYFAKALGWQSHVDRIVTLLGFTTFTPNAQVFAEAVARWQQHQGLPVDGIIGPNTWARIKNRLNLKKTSGQPSSSPSRTRQTCPVLCPPPAGISQAEKTAIAITSRLETNTPYCCRVSATDGISMGMLQWNLLAGTLQDLLNKFEKRTGRLQAIFGSETARLKELMALHKSRAMRRKAVQIAKKDELAKHWESRLLQLCKDPQFCNLMMADIQGRIAHAKRAARQLRLRTIRGLTMMFDIQVGDGYSLGANQKYKDKIDLFEQLIKNQEMNKGRALSEQEKLVEIAQQAAKLVKSEVKNDRLNRRLLIAQGQRYFRKKQWDLDQDFPSLNQPWEPI